MATIYYRNNDEWITPTAVFKKIDGVWVEQTSLSNVLEANTKYIPRTKLDYLIEEHNDKLLICNNRILVYAIS